MIHSWTGLSSVKHRSVISTSLLASNAVRAIQPAVVHGRWPLSHASESENMILLIMKKIAIFESDNLFREKWLVTEFSKADIVI